MIAKAMELASQFKSARERLGLSQSQAAQQWDVNLRTLQDWEAGRRFPRGPVLQRLWPILFPPDPKPDASSGKRRRKPSA